MEEKRIKDTWSILLLVCILLLGCTVRCWNIRQSFWWDEIWSTMTYAKAHSLWQVVSSLGYYFNNHIFYSLVARGSIALLGESEVTARLPAVIMGVLGVAGMFYFGRRFVGTSSGVIASLLLAVSAFHIDHSSEARGYSGLALFAILSSWYFLEGIKTGALKSWILYILFTVLGFYCHVFMCAVSLSQLVTFLLVIFIEKYSARRSGVTTRGYRPFLISLCVAGTLTLLLYAPVLPAFVHNIGKVRLVSVNRMPFILSLLSSLYPGVHSMLGGIVYGVLCVSGSYSLFTRNLTLLVYCVVLLMLPLSLYLIINPMFVFERYFIFTVPFALLVISKGMVELAERLRGVYRNGVVVVLLSTLVYVQYPAIATMLNQDRQSYREAVRYVEDEVNGRTGDLVFSIGYAGEHFRYYASGITILTPESLDELSALMEDKERIWCLITAWLSDIRPPYEDRALYSERPGQMEIYNYVKQHFVLTKAFSSKYPVAIYFLER